MYLEKIRHEIAIFKDIKMEKLEKGTNKSVCE